MSTKMRWDRRRPTFEPWYARLDRDPFGRESHRSRQAIRPKAKPHQADALEIEAGAKRKLADEYDAAQERGEVREANERTASNREAVGVADIGLTHKEIHEARIIRDAEKDEPGIVRRALDEALAAGEEPTRAKVKPAPVRVPLERPRVAAGAVATNYDLRTGDVAKAREALSGAVDAAIWCDGSAAPKNPGIVGAGAVILAGRVRVELHRGGWRGSNNMAELEAAIMALEVLPSGCRVGVTSDSQYLIFGMQKWRHSWRARDFKKNGADMANADRWRRLDALASERSIAWKWIRGHNGDAMNELADRLAAIGRTNGHDGGGL